MAEVFSKRLNLAMQNSKITQTELCLKTGIPKSAMSQYLSGAFEPKHDRLYILAQALHVNEAWLMGYDVPKTPERPKEHGVKIPVLGYVRAGIPVEAVEEILDYEEIPESMAKRGDFFGLKIKGDSMEPRICEGDVVIVRQQPDAESGEIAVVLVNGDEATVKRLVKQESGIMLQAFNPAYPPLFFSKKDIEEKPVSIVGKVVELRGKFEEI